MTVCMQAIPSSVFNNSVELFDLIPYFLRDEYHGCKPYYNIKISTKYFSVFQSKEYFILYHHYMIGNNACLIHDLTGQ